MSPKPAELLFPQYAGPFITDRHRAAHGPLPDLGVYCFEDCWVGFGGVVLSPDRRIWDGPDLVSEYYKARLKERLAAPKPTDLLYQALSGKLAPSCVIAMEEELICLVRPGSAVYGHWLLDMMPMLWLFMNSEHGRGRKRRVLISAMAPAWIYPMLKFLFDLDREDIVTLDEVRTAMRCRRVFVPSLLRVSPVISAEYNKFVAHALSKLDAASAPPPPTRFYISRSAVKGTAPISRQARGVDAIEASAAARGLSVVQPEGMSWVEQLQLFSRAELVVGEFGSGPHNTVFSPASTVTVVLANSVMTWTQSSIAALRGQRLQYIRPVRQKREQNRNVSEYDIEAVEQCLDQILGIL